MSEWHYSKDDQQLGPVTSAQLRQLAARGELLPTDLVWKDGMADWAPANRLKGLFANANGAPAHAASATAAAVAPTPVAPAPASNEIPLAPQPIQDTFPARHQPAPAAIPYYNASAGLADRVARTLKGFPPGTGFQGDWPLNVGHLQQLKEAEKHRKALRSFNSLCQLGVAVGVIGTLFLAVGVFGLASFGRTLGGAPVVAMAISCSILLGFTILCYLAGRAALHCRMWGPVTILVLHGLQILYGIATGMMAASSTGGAGAVGTVVGFAIGLGIAAVFISIEVKAILAIPRFLAAPLWAQEALVNAKL